MEKLIDFFFVVLEYAIETKTFEAMDIYTYTLNLNDECEYNLNGQCVAETAALTSLVCSSVNGILEYTQNQKTLKELVQYMVNLPEVDMKTMPKSYFQQINEICKNNGVVDDETQLVATLTYMASSIVFCLKSLNVDEPQTN